MTDQDSPDYNFYLFWMTFIMMIATLVMLIFAISADNSAKESLNSIKDSNNLTMKTVKWYEEPRPVITYSTNLDYLGNNGTLEMEMVPGYGSIVTNPGWLTTPVIVTLYNSGRAPWVSPRLYINLTADNTNTTFPFKIYSVTTPLDKIYYNSTEGKMFQSVDVPPYFSEKGQKIDAPLFGQDYPPYIENGVVKYPMLINELITTLSEENVIRRTTKSSGFYQSDFFGPFRLGTLEPGNKIDIEIYLFAIPAGEHFGQYNTGNLILTMESEKIESPINDKYNIPPIIFPLKSGPLIDVPSVAIGRVTIDKTTGKMIEFQSGARYPDGRWVPLGTLTNNAINAGYLRENIEEKYVNQSEYERLSLLNRKKGLTN